MNNGFKEMPQNLEAEKSVLGSILIQNKCMVNVLEKIDYKDFHSTIHQHLFSYMVKMYKKKMEIDEITLVQFIGKENIKSLGGITYILDLKNGIPSTRNLKSYIEIVKDCSNKRTLIKGLRNALEDAYDKDISEVIKNLSSSLITDNKEESQVYNASEMMERTLDYIEKAYSRGGKIVGMETGIKIYDKYSNGIKKQEISIIAARPSMGKTAFSLNLIHHLSKKQKVMMFQLEMGVCEIGTRLLASEAFTNGLDLQQGKIKDSDWKNISEAVNRLSTSNFIVDTTGGLDWEQIENRIRRENLQNGLDVVFIDHLGLIRIPNKNRNIEIGEITQRAKALTKELDIAIVFLSQLSRTCEQRADHRPMLSDLRDSGSVEQDADLITFLYRDEYYNKETEDKNIMEVIIAKNRNGLVGTVKVAYLKEFQIIGDLDVMD